MRVIDYTILRSWSSLSVRTINFVQYNKVECLWPPCWILFSCVVSRWLKFSEVWSRSKTSLNFTKHFYSSPYHLVMFSNVQFVCLLPKLCWVHYKIFPVKILAMFSEKCLTCLTTNRLYNMQHHWTFLERSLVKCLVRFTGALVAVWTEWHVCCIMCWYLSLLCDPI